MAQYLGPTETNNTTISSLPPEILLHIFEFCYEEFQREEGGQPKLAAPPWNYISGGLDEYSMRPTSTSKLFDRFRSPTRFPFALAAVSPFWNNLLLMEDKYWTEIIYTLGSLSGAVELDKLIQKFESYPPNIPLDLVILKESSGCLSPAEIQEMEYSQLQFLSTNYLNGRFPYLQSVSIEAHTGQSFPDLISRWQDSTPNADGTQLSSLVLTRESDTVYHSHNCLQAALDYQYHPALGTLAINGLNFDRFYPSIVNNQRLNLTQLIISDYTFSDDGLSFIELLQIFPILWRLDNLKLQNIILTYTPEEIPSSLSSAIIRLHLESMPLFTTTQLYRLCDFPCVEVLYFVKSSYCAPRYPFITTALILEDIEVDPGRILDFESELGDWEGSTLWIGGYPSNCKNFLEILRKYNKWTKEFRCPWMDTLYLYQIPELSLKKLKKMLMSRNKNVDYDDPEWRTNTSFGPAIRKLSINQCGITPLSKQDVDWFSSMVVEFLYIP